MQSRDINFLEILFKFLLNYVIIKNKDKQKGETMNINIAICDDFEEIRNQVFNLITDIFITLPFTPVIDCFSNGEELCAEIAKNQYDLIFLDIELPKMNGVDVGKYIRNTLKNERVQIAYISGRKDYAIELFDSRPINFLVKPLNREQIKKVIDKYIQITKMDDSLFTYQIRNEYYKIPLSDILYFASSGRKITIKTTDSENCFYSSLNKIYPKVQNKNFLFVHKSFLVNYKHILSYQYEQVIMDDKTVIPISQANRKEIRAAFVAISRELF